MFVPEPTYRRKRNKSSFWLWVVLILTILTIPGYLFGPRLYYQFADDPIARLHKQDRAYGDLLAAGKSAPGELLEHIEDSRRIVAIIEKDRPVDAEVHYYHGLFDFYELLLRLSLDAPALLKMTGRGILPEHRKLDELKAVRIEKLARRCSLRMRRTLAFDPEFKHAAAANMVIVYGDLLDTARTDPVLLDLLKKSPGKDIPDLLRPSHDWISLALYAFLGRVKELETLAGELEKIASGKPDADSGSAGNRIAMNADELTLLRGFGAYNGRNYLGALRLVRGLGKDEEKPVALRAEALRLRGEIQLVQRGPRLAEYWMREALKLNPSDAFIDGRIKQVQDSRKK